MCSLLVWQAGGSRISVTRTRLRGERLAPSNAEVTRTMPRQRFANAPALEARWRELCIFAALLMTASCAYGGGSAPTRTQLRVGTMALVASAPSGVYDNSPALAIDPRDSQRMVVANDSEGSSFSASMHWTSTGGRLWQETPLGVPTVSAPLFDPDVGFDDNGRLYLTCVDLDENGDPQEVWLMTSSDGGRSIDHARRIAVAHAFQVRLAVGAHGDIYVTWLEAHEVGNLSFPGDSPQIVEAASHDSGATFSPPVVVSDQSRRRVGASVPTVASDGNVVVVYEDFGGDVRDFQNLEGPPWPEPFSLVVSRSLDRGRSFSAGTLLQPNVFAAGRFVPFFPRYPSLASAANGTIYVSWESARDGVVESLVRRSDDEGRSWDPPRVLGTSGDVNLDATLMPAVVASADCIDAAFLGHMRGQPKALVHPILAVSCDLGMTFAATNLWRSPVSLSAGPEFTGAHGVPPYQGSRVGLAMLGDTVAVAWSATDSQLQGLAETSVAVR